MRIAVYHNLPSGGGKRALFEWTSRLSKTHQIDVYTLSVADHDFCDLRPFTNQYKIYEFTPHNLFASPFGRLNNIQRWRDLGRLTKLSEKIAREINAGDYDLVFANTCLYTFIPVVLKFIKKPSSYYLHEPFGRKFKRDIDRPYLQANKWRRLLNNIDPFIRIYQARLSKLQKECIYSTNMLLANSQYTRQQMRIEFNIDSLISTCGVDTTHFHPISGIKKEPFIISVGELSPRKGFDFIIESLKHIPLEKRPALRLVCNRVDDYEKAYIESLALKYRIKLEILTNLNTNELNLEYNKALFCVYSPVQEPFGLVPLEAMSCSAAVIGVKEGGVCESIVNEKTGLLVDRDPKKFAEAIADLLNNPNLISQFGKTGREHVQNNWTWERSTAALESHLKNIIGLNS